MSYVVLNQERHNRNKKICKTDITRSVLIHALNPYLLGQRIVDGPKIPSGFNDLRIRLKLTYNSNLKK